jgi:hypothetical protein
MLRVSLRSFIVLSATILSTITVTAQSDAVSPQDQIQLITQDIAAADSSRDTLTAINARLELASLVAPTKALRLTLEAASLADSASNAATHALHAHAALAELFTSLGEMTRANRERIVVQRLTEETLEREAADALERAHNVNMHMAAERDSLSILLGSEREAAVVLAKRQEASIEQWKLIAYAAAGTAAFILLLFTFLFVRHAKRTRKELKELKQEVTWLRMVNRKAIEEQSASRPAPAAAASAPPPSASAPAPAPVPASPQITELTGDDAMLLALVRRRGAERLSTLRDARQRGDHDKVIRVVHSLKPQLVGLDAEYYTALCARLVAQGAPQNGSWNADLDALERGMGQLLAAH